MYNTVLQWWPSLKSYHYKNKSFQRGIYGTLVVNLRSDNSISSKKLMDNRRWMKNGENSLQGTLSQTSYNLLIIVIQYYKQSKTVYKMKGPSWSWSYGSWIYNYLCNRCLSPLTLWFRIPLRWVVLDTTLCDKVYRWFAIGLWFSPGTLVSFTNNTDHNDITEILLKVALNTITLTLTLYKIIWPRLLYYLLIISISDKDYYRNVSYTLNSISKFLFF